MRKTILLAFICSIISTGDLQEINSRLFSPSINTDNAETQIWPLQALQRRSKPCSRRRDVNIFEEPWIPSYSSKITHQLPDAGLLQPQALKHDEVIESKTIESKSSASISSSNSESTPSRRSFNFDNYDPSVVYEEDCIEETESANQQLKDVENKAIKIIKDCLKKKSNDATVVQSSLGSSRRSMSESEEPDSLSNEYEFSREPDSDLSGSSRKSGLVNRVNDKGTVITEVRSKDTLLNPRICYACSTATNPSCWEPDKTTTVKYCTNEKSCVTKSFGTKNALTIIRDCSDSCESKSIPGIEPKYHSCNLCHSDFCNSAFSINGYNLFIILIISIAKCTIIN